MPASKCNVQPKGDKYITYDKFRVKDIEYNDNREITGLTILNQDGKVVYSLNSAKGQTAITGAETTPPVGQKEPVPTSPTAEQMKQMTKELERTGVALDTVLSRYQISSVEEMTLPIFNNAMNSLKKTKKKAA